MNSGDSDMRTSKSFAILISVCLIVAAAGPSLIKDNSGSNPTVVPVAQLREARQFLGSTQSYTTEFPLWVNRTLLEIGQKFLVKNFYGYLYGMGLTTLLVGASTDARRVVISAGNTTEAHKASKRYLINVLHFWYWATADLDPDPTKGNADLFESLNTIHAVHAKVGLAAHNRPDLFKKPLIPNPPRGENPYKLKNKLWRAFERDLLASRWRAAKAIPIFPPRDGGTPYSLNQFAMTAQLWAFAAYPILSPEQVLIYGATEEELWGYIHFWAFIGHAVGIEDRFNVCLQKNLSTAREYFRDVLEMYFVPVLFDLDYESKVVMEVGVKAIMSYFHFVDLGIALHRFCIDILDIECPSVRRAMPAISHVYNSVLERIGRPFSEFNSTKAAINFVINGMIQVSTLKYFNLNTLIPKNFREGLLALEWEILRTSDVYWNESANCETETNQNSIYSIRR